MSEERTHSWVWKHPLTRVPIQDKKEEEEEEWHMNVEDEHMDV
jgi:hypothetical protein